MCSDSLWNNEVRWRRGSRLKADDRLNRDAFLAVFGRLVDLIEVVELHQLVERKASLRVEQRGRESCFATVRSENLRGRSGLLDA